MSFYQNRTNYFSNLSYLNKQVRHDRFITGDAGPKRKSFFRLNDEEELTAACVNWAHFPCVVHFGYAGKYSEEPGQMKKRLLLNELLFLHKCTATDMAGIQTAKDVAFSVMEEFIKKMGDEFDTDEYCSIFGNIDMGMFSFAEHGPVNTTLYGWKLTFNDETFLEDHDADKWYES